MGSQGATVTDVDQLILLFARSYQIEALEKAIKQNTIVFLETGSGKTLIAVMLLSRYAHLIRKPSPFIAVFLVPTVVLVNQQAKAVMTFTDLKVGQYWGEKGVDYWNASDWKKQQEEYELLVMTPAILLDALRHRFLSLDIIKVMIFDECHNVRKKHPYACIMTEFYHCQLRAGDSELPRILGMTASPVRTKGSSAATGYWKEISELESLMNSKVYTCASESVLAEYNPVSNAKYRFYKNMEIPPHLSEYLTSNLNKLRGQYEQSIENSNLSESSKESVIKRLSKLVPSLEFCFHELGIWSAAKAAEAYSFETTDLFSWGKMDIRGETIVKDFCKEANKIFRTCIPSEWSIRKGNEVHVNTGCLTTKVVCLIESLAEYRHLKDLRCIIFVQRVITAIVLKHILCELEPELSGWKTEYTAGNNSTMQSQNRTVQNKIVEEFRKGMVNIIVATSILEEGLDVPGCNLVIRFDQSDTICSFIQSRGRARMHNSDFLLLLRSGDKETLNKVNNYLLSGQIMRDESLSHASEPCAPLDNGILDEVVYKVESTGAKLTLSSSIGMIYFYCSRLPSDGYFKPYPRFVINKELGTCSIYFPNSCPLPSVHVSGDRKILKQLACLEACKQLHLIGALTDYLVPDTVEIAAQEQEIAHDYVEEQVRYFPSELVSKCGSDSRKLYYFYLIKLRKSFEYEYSLQDIVLGVNNKFELDSEELSFDLEADRGVVSVSMTYNGTCTLTSEQITLSRQFQLTVLRVLLDHGIKKLKQAFEVFNSRNDDLVCDYLLLPANCFHQNQLAIDWKSVRSVLFLHGAAANKHGNCSSEGDNHNPVHTKNGVTCGCLMENSLVYTPHTGRVYCTTKRLRHLNANSLLKLNEEEVTTYKNYYKQRYGINLTYEQEPLFAARQVFMVRNFLQRGRQHKEKDSSSVTVELPPELCHIVLSPICINTFYSFSFIPSIMHRIESWLIALNLKKMHLDQTQLTTNVPAMKVLEAITTKKCQEDFHLESLETLGDSFLKYAASQHLFKLHQSQHEGVLSSKRERIIANVSLCKLGCDRHLPGFIRNEPFKPKAWIVPGDHTRSFRFEEEVLSSTQNIYWRKKRVIKMKVVADVVEALIGVFLSHGGERAALSFMDWLGIKINFGNTPYERDFPIQPQKILNVKHLESLLNHSFKDATLLVEGLTHGSYMLPEIPRCYQRLEFLGDAVLDYLITEHLYKKYPGMSPGMLTDLRSASVNNDCYAQSAVKFQLHKHVQHGSQDLHRHIASTVESFNQLSVESTFGWESETTFPKVLGDIMESLAGAIFVDSGYDKDRVFKSIQPLLEPLVTPETYKAHPVRELHDMCQKCGYTIKKSMERGENNTLSFTVEVEVDAMVLKDTAMAADKKMAEKLASKSVLKSLKESL